MNKLFLLTGFVMVLGMEGDFQDGFKEGNFQVEENSSWSTIKTGTMNVYNSVKTSQPVTWFIGLSSFPQFCDGKPCGWDGLLKNKLVVTAVAFASIYLLVKVIKRKK